MPTREFNDAYYTTEYEDFEKSFWKKDLSVFKENDNHKVDRSVRRLKKRTSHSKHPRWERQDLKF